jgi:L-threonylcarbamoyladenylate synthase
MGSPPANRRPRQALATEVAEAVGILRNGGVVAVPTDTLYGLAASALVESAVERVFRIKGRSDRQALPVLLAEASEIDLYAMQVPDDAWKLADRFFPGPLTLVLQGSGALPDAVTAGMGTVALRVPDHPVPRAIVRGLGAPITGTSANRSGSTGLATAEAVRRELGDDIDYVVEAERLPVGVPSTVVDLSNGRVSVLREGAVSVREIAQVCQSPVTVDRGQGGHAPPGLKNQ